MVTTVSQPFGSHPALYLWEKEKEVPSILSEGSRGVFIKTLGGNRRQNQINLMVFRVF
jgi:hypothetical protein